METQNFDDCFPLTNVLLAKSLIIILCKFVLLFGFNHQSDSYEMIYYSYGVKLRLKARDALSLMAT